MTSARPPLAADRFPSAAFVRLDERVVAPRIDQRFTNPSIHPGPTPPSALIRLVNYRLQSGRYVIADADEVVRTTVFRAVLDPHLALESMHLVVDRAGVPETDFPIQGFEDCRPFDFGGVDYAIGAVRCWNAEGVVQQVLLRFDADEIVSALPLSQPADGHQKNWMPVVGTTAMTFVDRCAPLRLRVVDPDLGTVRTIDVPGSDEPAARSYRGGSQVIRCGDRWLAVVHEVDDDGDGARRYRHRFVAFDERLRPCAATGDFSFVGARVEFCAGLRLHGDDVVASFGVADAEAWLGRFRRADVEAALVPLTAGAPRSARPVAVSAPARPRAGIVSVTLAHGGREDALAEALASVVDSVDRCLVIDTSASATIHAVAASTVADRLVAAEWPWTGDFGAARSASLELAASLTDAAWALIVDSDEAIDIDPVICAGGLAAALAALPDDVHSFSAWDHERTYTKVRGVRLPSVGRFVGATHEYFDSAGRDQVILPGVTFRERTKSPAELAAKSERDVAALRRLTAQRPLDGRWWYYLGDALAIGGDRSGAIAAFRRCADVDTWPEQAAWACYREAQLWEDAGDHDTAIERCAAGLALYPGIAELAWLAGVAAFRAGRHRDAAAFANLAIVHGEYIGVADPGERILFRHLPALYEGPFDVLRYAYRALGDIAAAERAEADHRAASAARLLRTTAPPAAPGGSPG